MVQKKLVTPIGPNADSPPAGAKQQRAKSTPGRVRAIPVQARARQSVDQILDAAASLLDEVGLDGFNTNLLAQRAGVLVRTIYRYFPDKYAVILALAQRLSVQWELWTAHDFAALKGDDWESVLRRMISSWVKRAAGQPGAISVIKALGAVPQLREFDLHLLERMVANMEAALNERGVELPEARLREVCRVMLVSINSGTELYFRLSPAQGRMYLDELTKQGIAYLKLYL